MPGQSVNAAALVVVKFAELTEDEEKAVERIIKRAATMEWEYGSKLDRWSLRMDLEATHATCRLDLKRLAEFPDFDFAHDIYGIMRHLNRRTGELEDCFLPRCAARVAASDPVKAGQFAR